MSKTFVANGTGNQQTLSELDSDKIPVYSTEADLDTDLANLADGELALYPSEGANLSVPVDKVESGNLRAVTSNAVYEAFGEIQTGEATLNLTVGQQGVVNVTFPKEFSKIPYVFVTINDNYYSNEVGVDSVSAITKTGCTIRGYNYFSAPVSVKIAWLAIAQ